MKKLLFSLIIGSVLALALFSGCDNFAPPDVHDSLPYAADLERKDVLALKHLQIPHASEDTLASYVMDFIKITAASETGTERSVRPAPAVAITKTTEIIHPVQTGFAETTADKRSARSVIGPGRIPFYVFTLENQQTGETGFALTCGDNRIGNVLAVVEQGNYDDDNPFLSVFYSQLNDYIEETIGIYNDITEADIENALSKSNEGARATAPDLPVTDVGKIGGLVPVGSQNDGINNKELETVRWHQDYNAIINKVFGLPQEYESTYKYVTGCVPTAIAIIMAYHSNNRIAAGKPVPYSHSQAPEYEHIEYDWEKMKEGTDVDAIKAIGVLMYEIGLPENANSKHKMGYVDENYDPLKKGEASTSTNRNNPRIAYRNMGYIDPGNFIKYDFTGIKTSINNGEPVQVAGQTKEIITTYIFGIEKKTYEGGHQWVIDGYSKMKTTVKDKYSGEDIPDYPLDYVHCNLGWGKGYTNEDKYICYNGWYINGVFTTEDIPKQTRSGVAGFYQYNIQMLTGIRPK